MNEDEKLVESLKSLIIDDTDKILFDEATNCFLNGNYRAAYIMTWITLIESIKRKIYVLADMNDNRATVAKTEIENLEKTNKSIDKLLIDKALHCELVSSTENTKIQFFWGQRCVFAHPYNLSPQKFEVEYILTETISIMLGKDVYFNKDYINTLINDIIEKSYFLSSDSKDIRAFAKKTVLRIQPQLHPFVLKTILSEIGKLLKMENKISEINKLKGLLIELIINTPKSLEETDWTLEKKVKDFPYESFISLVHMDTWNLFPENICSMLFRYFEELELTSVDNNRLKKIVSSLVLKGVLDADKKIIFYKKLDKLSFVSAIMFYGDSNKVFERIEQEYKSGQFKQQNDVTDFLKTDYAINILTGLDNQLQIKLGQLINSAAKNNHFKSQSLKELIISRELNYGNWLRAGIATGSFLTLNGNKFEYDHQSLLSAIKILNDLPEDIQNSIYDNVENEILNDNVSDWIKDNSELGAFRITKNHINKIIETWDDNNKVRFDKLSKIIESYFSNLS